MKKMKKMICDVCGEPMALVPSLDMGYAPYKQTCESECWHCTGCNRKGRKEDPRCDCSPCPLCNQPVAPGGEHLCDEAPF